MGNTDATAPTVNDSRGDTIPRAGGGGGTNRTELATTNAYETGAVLGRGGMGEVVLARDPRIGRDVALKRMNATAPSEEALARFLREAKIQARLDHPAIVPVHEIGFDLDGRPYFTMKRLAGSTLADRLERGSATQKEMLRALIDVCRAIELAHARGVVHRDLKPANIMLGDYGEVYVLDWGIARVLGTVDAQLNADIDTAEDTGTQAGAMLGTPGYMPPEQALGADVGIPADIYALGATLFEVLAGEPLHPRGGGAIGSTLEAGNRSPATRQPERAIAPELDALCVAALAMDATQRPTAHELADRLQRYLDGDRDVAQRRAIAAAQLAIAREALSSGDPARRGEAVHAAGRALALDPDALEAAELVAKLIIEPPAQLPPELAAALARDEAAGVRRRSRRAIVPYLTFFGLVPFLPWLDVINWPMLFLLFGVVGGMAILAWVNWRLARVPPGVFLLAHLATAVVFSRLVGPFVITPTLICGILLAATAVPWLNDRRWMVVLWTVAAAMTPIVLEWLGWWASTWHLDSTGLVSRGVVFAGNGSSDAFVTVTANVAALVVIGAFARRLARDRRDAQRDLFVQAWHLQQLLPRRDGQLAKRNSASLSGPRLNE